MLKERIQEIFEFSKSESPYKKANKGWINKDIFLDLGPASEAFKQKREDAKVTILWNPINSLISNIFFIIIIGSIMVFTSISFAKDRFNFDLFNTFLISNSVEVSGDKVSNKSPLSDLASISPDIDNSPEVNDLDQQSTINSLDDNSVKPDQEILTNKIYKEELKNKDIKINKDIKVAKENKSKSNFI